MQKPFAVERKDQILGLIQQKGRVTVDELIKGFKVSGATIRRDLEFLERQGLITRAHGGAISKSRVSLEPNYFEEKQKFLEEKRRIGKKASKLVEEGEVIFLETSTTILEIAKNIKNKTNLTVVTNSLDIAQELHQAEGIDLIMTGGNLRKRIHALMGPLAEVTLSQMRIDKAFMGVSALDIDYGMTTANVEEAQTRKKIIEASNKIIAVTDHSKFGKQNFIFVIPIEKIDIIVTDKGISPQIKKEMERKGVEVIVA
ncbi:DeoR/GlpR transcriptional regulator [Candidatus Aerophobetes bacterium]|nr:DeoR/GlpR transcriptional regulator [Candidatus Aerophobetes bacterium]